MLVLPIWARSQRRFLEKKVQRTDWISVLKTFFQKFSVLMTFFFLDVPKPKISSSGLNWENTRSLAHFSFFSPREQKKCYSFSHTFFGSLRRFLHSLHSTTVAPGRYVFRYGLLRPPLGHPRGDPGLAPDSAALRSRLRDPPLLPFRSVRCEKSFGIQKSVSRTSIFSVENWKIIVFLDFPEMWQLETVKVLVVVYLKNARSRSSDGVVGSSAA